MEAEERQRVLKVNAKEHYFIGFRHRMSSVARHLKVFDFPRRMNVRGEASVECRDGETF